MTWLIFTLMSTSLIKDVDHKQFKSYTACSQYVARLPDNKSKACMTTLAKFKQPKKKVKK